MKCCYCYKWTTIETTVRSLRNRKPTFAKISSPAMQLIFFARLERERERDSMNRTFASLTDDIPNYLPAIICKFLLAFDRSVAPDLSITNRVALIQLHTGTNPECQKKGDDPNRRTPHAVIERARLAPVIIYSDNKHASSRRCTLRRGHQCQAR